MNKKSKHITDFLLAESKSLQLIKAARGSLPPLRSVVRQSQSSVLSFCDLSHPIPPTGPTDIVLPPPTKNTSMHPNYPSLRPRHPRCLSQPSIALSVPPSPHRLIPQRAACSAPAEARRHRWSTGGGRGACTVAGRCTEDQRRGREAIDERQEGEPLTKTTSLGPPHCR
jgi:hypothetical protein